MARIAEGLGTLRSQIQARVPKAPKNEFGWVASDAHSQQNPSSDHESDSRGIVHALDIPHYPELGLNTYKLFDHMRATKDKRVKYCISNRKIFGDEAYGKRNGRKPWTNYPYNGANPHDEHMHVSINKANEDDARPWDIGAVGQGVDTNAPPPQVLPILKEGSEGPLVQWVQLLVMTDGDFGPATEAAVKRFQREQGLVNDGKIGKETWKALEKLAETRGVPLPKDWPKPPTAPTEPPPIVVEPPPEEPPPIPEPPPVPPPEGPAPVSPETRLAMADQILDYEARRDGSGRLVVYDLPAGDGGGDYEVAGINEKYHPVEAAELRALIKAGRHAEAEARAQEIIATYTDVAAKWHDDPGVQFYLRDCVFNRGPTGAMRILQRAVSVKDDGAWGPLTRAAVEALTPTQLLARLRVARENYERVVVGRNETSQFWKGLVNRWDNSLAAASKFHREEGAVA
jgi:lysozyme family protein